MKDKAKYKLKTADLTEKYKDQFSQAARKGNITLNESDMQCSRVNLLSGAGTATAR